MIFYHEKSYKSYKTRLDLPRKPPIPTEIVSCAIVASADFGERLSSRPQSALDHAILGHQMGMAAWVKT